MGRRFADFLLKIQEAPNLCFVLHRLIFGANLPSQEVDQKQRRVAQQRDIRALVRGHVLVEYLRFDLSDLWSEPAFIEVCELQGTAWTLL